MWPYLRGQNGVNTLERAWVGPIYGNRMGLIDLIAIKDVGVVY